MDFVRLCTLAITAVLCTGDSARSEQRSQQPAKAPDLQFWPGDYHTFPPPITSNLSAEASKDNSQDFVLWNSNGNGFPWYGLTNQNLGMTLVPADDALRAHLKLPEDQGLVVAAIDFHSPAAQAGIEQNDILLQLEGARWRNPPTLKTT